MHSKAILKLLSLTSFGAIAFSIPPIISHNVQHSNSTERTSATQTSSTSNSIALDANAATTHVKFAYAPTTTDRKKLISDGGASECWFGNDGQWQVEFDILSDISSKFPMIASTQTLALDKAASMGIISNLTFGGINWAGVGNVSMADGWHIVVKDGIMQNWYDLTWAVPGFDDGPQSEAPIDVSAANFPNELDNHVYWKFEYGDGGATVGYRTSGLWTSSQLILTDNNSVSINMQFNVVAYSGNTGAQQHIYRLDSTYTDLQLDAFDKRYLAVVDPLKTGQWIDTSGSYQGQMRGHFALKLNEEYIGATLMCWDYQKNQLANYHQESGKWVSHWQDDQTHEMINWYNKMVKTYGDGTQETINRLNAIDAAISQGRLLNLTQSQVISWLIPGNEQGDSVNNYIDDTASYCLDEFLRNHFADTNFNDFQAALNNLPILDWYTNANTFNLKIDNTASSLSFNNYPDTVSTLLKQNITYDYTWSAVNTTNPTFNTNGTAEFSVGNLCNWNQTSGADRLSFNEVQGSNDGQDDISYGITLSDCIDQSSFGGWLWPTGGKDHLGLYGKGITDQKPAVYSLDGSATFSYKIKDFSDIDAIQLANFDSTSQVNTVEPTYLINSTTPGNCKYNNGTGNWDNTTWQAFLNYLYSLPADQIASALTAGTITPPASLNLGIVINFDFHCFMWVKPTYQSEIDSVDNLIDATTPVTYAGSPSNGTLTINFTTKDGQSQHSDNATFAKQFSIWNTTLWDKPANDPSYYADSGHINDFWNSLVNYDQSKPSPGGTGKSYLWETNISETAFKGAFQGTPDFTGTSDDSDTLKVKFSNMWKYIPTFTWRTILPDSQDKQDVTLTSDNFKPTESIAEDWQPDTQSHIVDNVAYIQPGQYHAIVVAAIKNDADVPVWFYSYNGNDNNTVPPTGVTVKSGTSYIKDNITYFPMTYTCDSIDADTPFTVWSKAGVHGTIADGLKIIATQTPPTPPTPKSPSHTGIIVGSVLGGIGVVAVGTAGTIYARRRRSGSIKNESRKSKRQRATDFNE